MSPSIENRTKLSFLIAKEPIGKKYLRCWHFLNFSEWLHVCLFSNDYIYAYSPNLDFFEKLFTSFLEFQLWVHESRLKWNIIYRIQINYFIISEHLPRKFSALFQYTFRCFKNDTVRLRWNKWKQHLVSIEIGIDYCKLSVGMTRGKVDCDVA